MHPSFILVSAHIVVGCDVVGPAGVGEGTAVFGQRLVAWDVQLGLERWAPAAGTQMVCIIVYDCTCVAFVPDVPSFIVDVPSFIVDVPPIV